MILAGRFLAGFTMAAAAAVLQAQAPARSVADGVYSEVQATRGAAAYDNACSRCHRSDLGGADGPALKDDRFNRMFAGKDLRTLYSQMVTTMPRGAPASLGEGVYLDILAHLLRENGFPAGAKELRVDEIDGVEVLPTQEKPLPPVGDFSYVRVSGCFARGESGTWWLREAGDPVAITPPDARMKASSRPPPAEHVSADGGSQAYHLLDAAAYDPASKVGKKVSVRGLLIRLPDEQRITISDISTSGEPCGD